MAQITPPVGFNLFVPQSMTGYNIFKNAAGSFPMFLVSLAMVFILIAFPDFATWLPQQMMPQQMMSQQMIAVIPSSG